MPDICGADGADLKPIIQEWHKQALPFIRTKSFTETWSDFLHAWPRVRSPASADPLADALRLAKTMRVTPRYDCPHTTKLVGLCAALQHITGGEPFFLSCRAAARLIGIDHETANKRLNMLIADKVLLLVQRQTERRARRYQFIGDSK